MSELEINKLAKMLNSKDREIKKLAVNILKINIILILLYMNF